MKRTGLFAAILLLAAAGLAFAEAEKISARDLWEAFRSDAEEATARYMGETMVVSGVVVETGMSIYMTPNVRISDTEGGPIYAICVLPRADVFKLSDFKPGQPVAFTGRIYSAGRDDKGVVIKECKAVAE